MKRRHHVGLYPLAAFRANPDPAASIDTPLHGFLPFPHVDHLHPDWGIALAASANGLEKMEGIQSRIQPTNSSGYLGSAPASNSL